MAETKGGQGKAGRSRGSESKNPTTQLIPTNPLSPSRAVIQVALLVGIPLVLLLLARYFLRQFFPTLGY
jgi:hypothetical protein